MPMLALLLLLSVFCSNALRAACNTMSPSALSTALLPADRFDPVTVMSESLPAPWATMVRSLPAATVEPKALDELRPTYESNHRKYRPPISLLTLGAMIYAERALAIIKISTLEILQPPWEAAKINPTFTMSKS
ncbi:hypothetical protein D3C85_1020880 [compost metagenome]